jgi:allantoicase
MSHAPSSVRFTNLVDLASSALGGRALACNDDFFASMHHLVRPEPATFDPDAYTDRGKRMDGWESRRKRGPGYDWCVLALGARGVIRAVDIDTSFFLGNHPPFAALEAAHLEGDGEIDEARWVEILPQSPLRPGSQNLFTIADAGSYTHVRLSIFPDGGVARLRVYGEVDPTWADPALDEATEPHVGRGEHDLASLLSGGKALACSDAFFGPMDNLLLPGRAANMGGGWETRRKRAPGHDWILVRLGAPGSVSAVEVDTNHFKGNYPDRCALRGIAAPGARVTDLVAAGAAWVTIFEETKLEAHDRRFIGGEQLLDRGPFTHVRLDIYPDGGVSRLRVWGRREARA